MYSQLHLNIDGKMAASYESLLLSSTESYSKKDPSRLFDESQLKDRLFVSFLDVVQFRTLQSCAVDVDCFLALPQNFLPLS